MKAHLPVSVFNDDSLLNAIKDVLMGRNADGLILAKKKTDVLLGCFCYREQSDRI
jgi:hypothetical protein